LTVGRFPLDHPASTLFVAVTILQLSLLVAGVLLCTGGTLVLGWFAGGAAQRSLGQRYDSWHRSRYGPEQEGQRRDTA
jgi:hypothetical protein